MDQEQVLTAGPRGDRAAFDRLVEQQQQAVYAYLRSRVLPAADVDDLCQEVFLRCYQRRVKFDSPELIRQQLIGIARNVLSEHLRKAAGRTEAAWTTLCFDLDSLAGNNDSQAGADDELLARLPNCLEQLGPSTCQALKLHYADRQQPSEISQHLHRSIGAVKQMMLRARQSLSRCLSEQQERIANHNPPPKRGTNSNQSQPDA